MWRRSDAAALYIELITVTQQPLADLQVWMAADRATP